MQFNESMLSESKSARSSIADELSNEAIKAMFLRLFPDAQFIGDEIPKQELIRVFELDESTATKHVQRHEDELRGHGYRTIEGEELRRLKAELTGQSSRQLFGLRTRSLSVFHVRAAFAFGLSLDHPTGKLLRATAIESFGQMNAAQQDEAVKRARAWELRTFYSTNEALSTAEGFKSAHIISVQVAIFRAMFGMTGTELRATRQQIHPGDKKTARNYMTEDELQRFDAVERAVLAMWSLRPEATSSEMTKEANRLVKILAEVAA